MQLVTLGVIGLFIYNCYLTGKSLQTMQFVTGYLSLLTQDQLNLIIESEEKSKLLRHAFALFSITTVFLLLGVFRVFGRLASRPFNLAKAMKTVRFLGLMFVFKAFFDFLDNPAMTYLWTYDNPPEFRAINFGVDILSISTLTQISIFLIGICLMFTGHLAVRSATRGIGIAGLAGSSLAVEEAYDEYEEAEEELAEAEAELEEAKEELAEAEADLQNAETHEEVIEAIEEIEEAKEEIVEAQDEILEAQEDLAEAETKLDALKSEIDKSST